LKLRTKFTASFILTALILCGVTLQVASVIVGRSYQALEARQADSDFHVVENAMRGEIETKVALMHEYGMQDSIHDYLAGDADFPVSEDVLMSSLLFADVDHLGFICPKGLKYAVARDVAEDGTPYLRRFDTVGGAGWFELLDRLEPGFSMNAILKGVSGQIFISTIPVVRSDGSGRYVGHVIIGSRIDDAFIANIKRKTDIDWAIEATGELGLVELTFMADRNALSLGEVAAAVPTEKVVSSHISVRDDITIKTATYSSRSGQTSVLISTFTPRYIMAYGNASIRTLMLILAGSMIVSLLVLQALLQGLLVGPVSSLTHLISGRDQPKRRDVIKQNQRSDEIGELYRTYQTLNRANEDKTEALKSAVAKAEAASVSKSEFLANMSHEIRTPMNGVLGMAQVMKGTELSEVQSHYVDLMYDSGMALMTVINDILDFSKVESGKMELDPEPFDLHAALDSVLALLASQARDKEIDLIPDFEGIRGRVVVGDIGRVRQVVTNLLGNAIKFTATGHVVVRASVSDVDARLSTVRIEVEDSGIGIPADKLDLIFDKFTQAEGSTTRQFGGTGLGLSISRRIVELMGGEIGVESEYGKGSTFWFELTMEAQSAGHIDLPEPGVKTEVAPERSDEAGSEVDAPVDGCNLNGVVALVVDDIDVNRRILSEQLTGWGAKAYCVDSAEKGLAVLKGIAARGGSVMPIVMSGVQMPDMDGVEFIRQIRADAAIAGTAVMVLSSVDDGDVKEAFLALDVASIVEKPASTQALIQALRETVARSGRVIAQQVVDPMPAPKHPKILIAEDNAVNRDVMRLILDGEPFDLHFVHDGKEAVDAMRVASFDLMLMDISMPVMDGVEATRAIRAHEAKTNASGTPIIAVTAHAMNKERDRYLAAGMNDHMPKPIIKTALLDMIGKWQGQATAQSQASLTLTAEAARKSA